MFVGVKLLVSILSTTIITYYIIASSQKTQNRNWVINLDW
jgi:hypothetical protein